MPRLAGIDIPGKKPILFGLQYVFGIGMTSAEKILEEAKIDGVLHGDALSEAQLAHIREIIDQKFKVEGDLRREIGSNIKRLKDVGAYRGIRHIRNLPVRGQRTHTNARTRKGRARIAIAGKKQAPSAK